MRYFYAPIARSDGLFRRNVRVEGILLGEV